jgi:large subunit ribosomal protein L9
MKQVLVSYGLCYYRLQTSTIFCLKGFDMQVILLQDIDTLGEKGSVVSVSEGYARNYLFPAKSAVVASAGALKDLERRISQIKAKAEKKHQEYLGHAERINALGSFSIEAHVGESGKLFGTITTKELSKLLQTKTGLDIDRKMLSLDQPIHKVGEYLLTVKFSPKVSAAVSIDVIPFLNPDA